MASDIQKRLDWISFNSTTPKKLELSRDLTSIFLSHQLCDSVALNITRVGKEYRFRDITNFEMNVQLVGDQALYPYFASRLERVQSFKDYNWPKSLASLITGLSDFGYFYLGRNDTCVCYMCGLSVSNWLLTGNLEFKPHITHAIIKPKCNLIQGFKNNTRFYTHFMFEDCKLKTNYLKKYLQTCSVGIHELEKYHKFREQCFKTFNSLCPPNPEPDQSEQNECIENQCDSYKRLCENEQQLTNLQERVNSNNLTCVICLTNDKEIVNFPCCHLSTCQDCFHTSLETTVSPIKKCIICREQIRGFSKIYIT